MFKFVTTIVLVISQLFFPSVYAGTLSSSKITISDSRAGQNSVSHSFAFTTATTGTIASIVFQYCTTASGTCTTPSGLVTTTAVQGSLTGIGTSTSDVATNGTITLNVTSPASISSGTSIIIPYSTITNPTNTNSSFFVRITTRDGSSVTIDTTTVAFATLTSTSFAVTADVGATLSVSIAPINTGTVNGSSINVTTSTASTIPFGTLISGSSKIAAHDVTVTTNASNGYVVTVKSDDPPLIEGSNNIDKYTGTNAAPTTWSSPAGSSANVNSGFVGYTTEDATLCTGTAGRFGSNKWAGPETTAYEMICNASAVLTGETTRIGWQAEVNGLQPAGSYTGTFVVVTTPTY